MFTLLYHNIMSLYLYLYILDIRSSYHGKILEIIIMIILYNIPVIIVRRI